jgi:hypothetical protein
MTALVAHGDASLQGGAVPDAIARYEEAIRLGVDLISHTGCDAGVGLAQALIRAGDLNGALARAADTHRRAHRAGYARPEGRR